MKDFDLDEIVGYWFAENIGEFVCPDCIERKDLRTRPHVIWTWEDVSVETGPLVCDRCGRLVMERGETPDSARRRWKSRSRTEAS